MKKLEYKKEILEAAKNKHQGVIDDIKKRIDDLLNSEMNANEDQFDLTQQSLNQSNNQIVSALADQLNFAVDEMNFLNRMIIDDQTNDTVAPGSVVKTDKQSFYVSASVEKFHVNGDEIFGLSTHAPLYEVMKGMKKGEKFSFNGRHYSIKEIF